MSCEVDVKEYFLGEASREDGRLVELHLNDCPACREELTRLRLTHAALSSLRDEEIPRRIAFVSDKVFEPRWYQRLWRSGPQLGFIAASMLTGAILVHAFARPTPAPIVTTVAAVDQAAIEREVTARVNDAVLKAVAASEVRQQKKTVELLQAAEKRSDFDRRATLAAFAEQNSFVRKQLNNMYAVSSGLGSGQ